MAEPTTRDRLVGATADLLRLGGYHATSVKAIVERAGAPFGSMYHHFPGGKEELGAAAITTAGLAYGDLIDLFFGDDVTDLIDATHAFFAGAAWTLTETDYADTCPIATVALEVASTNEDLRRATSTVFDNWIARASARFVQHGIPSGEAPRLAPRPSCCSREHSYFAEPAAPPSPWPTPRPSPSPKSAGYSVEQSCAGERSRTCRTERASSLEEVHMINADEDGEG